MPQRYWSENEMSNRNFRLTLMQKIRHMRCSSPQSPHGVPVIFDAMVILNNSSRFAAHQEHGIAGPVVFFNGGASSRFFLTCEHAGRLVPEALGDLGVATEDMARHIAYDIGAEGLSRKLALLLDAPLVLQPISRLVIDCNRPFESEECIVQVSDGTVVSGNVGLTPDERQARFCEIHEPFHKAVSGALEARKAAGKPSILISVHSFTPRMRHSGEARPWQLGLLANRDPAFADGMLAAFRSMYPDIPADRNVPYDVNDLSDYTIPVHGEKRGIPHVLIEVRSDQIEDEARQELWAQRLAGAIVSAAARLADEPPDVRGPPSAG
jgi:predicted N-formylglutamate amidohydrolase